jgi:hypothetical protein
MKNTRTVGTHRAVVMGGAKDASLCSPRLLLLASGLVCIFTAHFQGKRSKKLVSAADARNDTRRDCLGSQDPYRPPAVPVAATSSSSSALHQLAAPPP